MADRLTQLQDCLDQLLTQMYATVRYIDTHHNYASIPGQPNQFTPPAADGPSSTHPPAGADATAPNTQPSSMVLRAQSQPTPQPSAAGAAPSQATNGATGGQQQQQPAAPAPAPAAAAAAPHAGTSQDPTPDPPAVFSRRLAELAQDVVLKEQQIEALIRGLPGVGSSQAAQERRLVELEREMGEVEREWGVWVGGQGEGGLSVREEMLEKVEGWIAGLKRV